ncbi:hypothetical protein D3C76_429780 [compost metagenome]
MQFISKLPPSKAWRLARNTVTGQIYTYSNGRVYCGNPAAQQKAIDDAKAAFALDGTLTPDGTQSHQSKWDTTLSRYVPVGTYTGPSLHDVELFDHIPVVRLQAKFKHLYCGKSDVAVMFTTPAGHTMLLRGSSSDKFFELVGQGKILMDSDGYYDFNVSFTKASEKVFMELHGY